MGTGARENTGFGMMVLVEGVGLDIIGGEMVKLVEFVKSVGNSDDIHSGNVAQPIYVSMGCLHESEKYNLRRVINKVS